MDTRKRPKPPTNRKEARAFLRDVPCPHWIAHNHLCDCFVPPFCDRCTCGRMQAFIMLGDPNVPKDRS